jgi:hypothetical protein
MKSLLALACLLLSSFMLVSCQSSGSGGGGGGGGSGMVSGNEGGSEPVNENEGYEMQKAVNRCHRTGGTRVVKIKGELKCF